MADIDKPDLPFASEHPPHPTHWFNAEGLQMRLQVFVIVRDSEGRVCCVREKGPNTGWKLAGETVWPNEDVNEAAARTSKLWFGKDLEPRVTNVLTWPDTGDKKWYILFLYEATVDGVDDLEMPDDTEAFEFVEPGQAPGPWGMSHGDVFATLE